MLATNCISAEYVEGFEAFSVGLTKSTSVMTGQHVLYDRVITVRDQALYDVSTGTFTASSTGIYIFHYHALASSDSVSTKVHKLVFLFVFLLLIHFCKPWSRNMTTSRNYQAPLFTMYEYILVRGSMSHFCIKMISDSHIIKWTYFCI